MERRLAGPWQRLVGAKERLLAGVGKHPREFRERRPTPAEWSIAEVIEHLVLVERGIAAALAKAPDPARPRVVRWDQGFRFLAMRVALKGGARIKAPTAVVLPTGELPWHALLSRWEVERRGFEEWLLSVEPEIIHTPRFRHPIVGWLDIPRALTFVGDHLDHHVGQIARIERGLR